MKTAFQTVALRAYRSWPIKKFLTTPIGRSLFEDAYLIYKRRIEAANCDPLAAFILPGQWAIDVGANIGYFSGMFAGWTSGGGKVLAIEPEAANFARLVARLGGKTEFEGRIQCVHAAACERDGLVHLAIQENHPGDHRLAAEEKGVPTPGYRLDTLWTEAGKPPVGLMKIDVQGAELQVLSGARDLIAKLRPAILIEVDDAALASFGTSPAAVLQALGDADYDLFLLSSTGLKPTSAAEIIFKVQGPPATYCDVLAVANPNASGLTNAIDKNETWNSALC